MNEKNISLESTDYDISNVGKFDERFEAGKKDAVFIHILGWISTIIASIWMYVFGCVDPSQMKYFLGVPLWISGAIIIYLVMFVIGMIWIHKWKEFPLTARNNQKD
jgi:hypothetical protein